MPPGGTTFVWFGAFVRMRGSRISPLLVVVPPEPVSASAPLPAIADVQPAGSEAPGTDGRPATASDIPQQPPALPGRGEPERPSPDG